MFQLRLLRVMTSRQPTSSLCRDVLQLAFVGGKPASLFENVSTRAAVGDFESYFTMSRRFKLSVRPAQGLVEPTSGRGKEESYILSRKKECLWVADKTAVVRISRL